MGDYMSYATVEDFVQMLSMWAETVDKFTISSWEQHVMMPHIASHPCASRRDRAILAALAFGIISIPTGPCPRCSSPRMLRSLRPSRQNLRPLGIEVWCSVLCPWNESSVTARTIFDGIAVDKFLPWLLLYASEYQPRVLALELDKPRQPCGSGDNGCRQRSTGI